MMNRVLTILLSGVVCLANLTSCKNSQDQGEKAVHSVVPVTVTMPRTGKMAEYTELMATSAFLVRTVIKSPVTGYVEKCSVSPGDKVVKNQVLFQLRTKEAAALDQKNRDSLDINGLVTMKATMTGVVAAIDHPQGDFIQEGDVLSTLVEPESLVFLLEAPFEMNKIIHTGVEYKLVLPGDEEIVAVVKSVLPSMSGASQTQRMVLKPRVARDIPENLTAQVKILQTARDNAVILPKSCLLNDEIMKSFWVMKLINDTMAVKIPVRTGIQGTDSIEVVSPVFKATDRILTSGNYGLGDTAVVRIIHLNN